ncbi:MAG: SulP family inorganic anion transporter [Anaerolineae bacterium]|nr:SulP family inorganic anion transporter [Anaerolineae bacterium]
MPGARPPAEPNAPATADHLRAGQPARASTRLRGSNLKALAAARFPLKGVLRREFAGYNAASLRGDVLAGITVGAVALPLALALGMAAGASAGAGLVTSILAGLIIGGLGGAGYQISGASGSMSAVLIVLAMRFGLEGVLMAGLLAGILILLIGILDLGRVVNFIPTAVISGFTSGIALIIFIGQIDHLLGVQTPANPNALARLLNYLQFDYAPMLAPVLISLTVIGLMVWWPKAWNARFPASVLGLIVTTAAVAALNLDVPMVGAIPQTILLDDRLTLTNLPWEHFNSLIGPAISLAGLCAIESLLCGTVGGRMTGQKLDLNQELIAQGVGNIVLPFFGGIPAAAVIARTSVAIKSGARTRVTSIVHAGVLLLAALVMAPLLGRVPLAALAGVLAVTAWRINDWVGIRGIFGRRFKSAMLAFTATMLATIALDLTQAIAIGFALSALMFIYQISRTKVVSKPVSAAEMREEGYEMKSDAGQIAVVNVMGPLFFGTANTFNTTVEDLSGMRDVILNLHMTPLVDTTGLDAIEDAITTIEGKGGRVYVNGLTEPVQEYLGRAGILERLGDERIFDTSDQAIIAADRYRAAGPAT